MGAMRVEIVVAWIGLGGVLAGVVAGWGLTEISTWRRAKAEDRERLRLACHDMITAVGELQAALVVHHGQWLTHRARIIPLGAAFLEFLATEKSDRRRGMLAAFRVVREWADAEVDAARTQTIPAVTRVNAAALNLMLLGDEDLRKATAELVDAAQKATSALASGKRKRESAATDLVTATESFGLAIRRATGRA